MRRRAGGMAALAAALAVAACAGLGPSRGIAVPGELPNRTNDQVFAMRWALERPDGLVRAVGFVDTSADQPSHLVLTLLGIDAQGRIVSQGVESVRWGFAREAQPFEVQLSPTGREARFELRVLEYTPTGRRR